MLNAEEQQWLLQAARDSITQTLYGQTRPAVRADHVPPALLQPGASFVTLLKEGQLRGCIGSLEAQRPLLEDVQENARAAAFRDPRFPPLTAEEWPLVRVEVSVLSTPQRLPVTNEEELLHTLQPGKDGLILQSGPHRATFLPSVWEQLPDPRAFVQALKQKAGLPASDWPANMQAWRYCVQSIA